MAAQHGLNTQEACAWRDLSTPVRCLPETVTASDRGVHGAQDTALNDRAGGHEGHSSEAGAVTARVATTLVTVRRPAAPAL